MNTTKRVLIVDDDDDVVQMLAMRCRSLGMETDVAHNALTAITMFAKSTPDLLIVDVDMPTGSGLSLCEMILTSPDDVKCPIVVLTGRQDTATVQRCSELCVYYLHKRPDVWNVLESVIYELVDIEPLTSDQNSQAETNHATQSER